MLPTTGKGWWPSLSEHAGPSKVPRLFPRPWSLGNWDSAHGNTSSHHPPAPSLPPIWWPLTQCLLTLFWPRPSMSPKLVTSALSFLSTMTLLPTSLMAHQLVCLSVCSLSSMFPGLDEGQGSSGDPRQPSRLVLWGLLGFTCQDENSAETVLWAGVKDVVKRDTGCTRRGWPRGLPHGGGGCKGQCASLNPASKLLGHCHTGPSRH